MTVTHPAPSCVPGVPLSVTGADHYRWIPDSILSCDTCGTTIANPYGGFTYSVTGVNIHMCRDTLTTYVFVDPRRNIVMDGKHNVCPGECDTIAASGITGNYVWTGPGLSCSICEDVIACTPASAVYTLVTTDSFNCSDTNFFTIDVRPIPTIFISPEPAVACVNDSLSLLAQGAATYVWRPNINISCDTCDRPSILGVTNLVYTVMATSIYGCKNTKEIPLTVLQHTDAGAGTDTTICYGQSVPLFAWGGGDGYQWVNPAGLSSATIRNPIAKPDSTTIYEVIIKENACFKDTAFVRVGIESFPRLGVSPGAAIIAGNQVQLRTGIENHVPIASYRWTPANTLSCDDCPNPLATPTANTTYSVTVTSVHGCITDTFVTINMFCDRSEVFIPNTFTPNNDGLNDAFFVSGKGLNSIVRMSIYNRWGQLVFKLEHIAPNDPSAGWDGTFKGSTLQPDAFIYLIDVECELGAVYHFQGDISIVR